MADGGSLARVVCQRHHGGVVGYDRVTAHQLHHGGVAGGADRLSLFHAMVEAGENLSLLGIVSLAPLASCPS
jgi:hypothetical protein